MKERRGCPGSGSASFPRKAGLPRVVTFPHWAEGSVAVVGLPAGGSWRRGAGLRDSSFREFGKSVCGVVPPRLVPASFRLTPRRGASRRRSRPLRATAVEVPFEVSVCVFPPQTGSWRRPAPRLGGERLRASPLALATCCHHPCRGALAPFRRIPPIRSFMKR